MDCLLEMRHEEHVAGFVELVVEGIVVDMAQHRAGTQNGGIVLVKVCAQDMEEIAGGGRGSASWGDDRVESGWYRFPSFVLACRDDLFGL